eukprot:TRINITY_DN2504_c0_g1_i1.p1 TRINITY_DN2504_c0_g1~~TRINITY_DN2504_c0_g1_i1.p1  ORF type:complete len:295 (+),score=42.68 TRINITY_DN2504_c0_g1_i1:691-1575(+)
MTIGEVLELMRLSYGLELPSLTYKCKKKFLQMITAENVFEMMIKCQESLEFTTEWLLAFVSFFKVPLSDPQIVVRICTISPNLMVRITQAMTSNLIFPPTIPYVEPTALSAAYEYLFKSRDCHDFELTFHGDGESQVFLVHRFILRRWDFFRAVLSHGGVKAVHEMNIPVSTFEKILEYFYVGIPKTISFEDAGWILHSVQYYLLQNETNLITLCQHVISSRVTPENWFDAWNLGVKLDNTELREIAETVVVSGVPVENVLDQMRHLVIQNEELKRENRALKKELKEKGCHGKS